MPALVRRFLIWAAVDGLIVQAKGPAEHQKTIQIDYRKRQIQDVENDEVESGKGVPLESHGIIGRTPFLGGLEPIRWINNPLQACSRLRLRPS